jgi:hypothetical protein
VAASVVNTWSAPGAATPTVIPVDAAAFFTRAFGTMTLAAGSTVRTPLCAAGDFDAWSLTWTFDDAAGHGPFTTDAVRFLATERQDGSPRPR